MQGTSETGVENLPGKGVRDFRDWYRDPQSLGERYLI
jgi:hypothetical protein